MSSRSLHHDRDRSGEATHTPDAHGDGEPTVIRVTVTVANRHTFDTHLVTGRQIKERANVPADFALYRRMPDGNEPIPDEAEVRLRTGDHFFARPSSDPR